MVFCTTMQCRRLLVLVAVLSTNVDVLKCFWELTIDAVALCYTVITIRLAVDNSARGTWRGGTCSVSYSSRSRQREF